MNPNPLGYQPKDKTKDYPSAYGTSVAGGATVGWIVPQDAQSVTVDTGRHLLLLSRDETLALYEALNAALPHMAQKIDP